jgi:hypothetical protein
VNVLSIPFSRHNNLLTMAGEVRRVNEQSSLILSAYG